MRQKAETLNCLVIGMPLTEQSRTVLALGSALGSVFLALTILEYLPFKLTDYGSSLTLFVTYTILILESVYEEARRRGVNVREVLESLSYQNVIALVLAGVGYLLAVYFLFSPSLPVEFRGLASFIICLHAIGVVVERFR